MLPLAQSERASDIIHLAQAINIKLNYGAVEVSDNTCTALMGCQHIAKSTGQTCSRSRQEYTIFHHPSQGKGLPCDKVVFVLRVV